MRGAPVLPTPPNQSQTCSAPALQEMASDEHGRVLGPCSPPQPPSCDPPRLQEEHHIPVRARCFGKPHKSTRKTQNIGVYFNKDHKGLWLHISDEARQKAFCPRGRKRQAEPYR